MLSAANWGIAGPDQSKDEIMDYSKSGNSKTGRHEPRNVYEQRHGAPKTLGKGRPDKAELLARMKENAEKAKKAND